MLEKIMAVIKAQSCNKVLTLIFLPCLRSMPYFCSTFSPTLTPPLKMPRPQLGGLLLRRGLLWLLWCFLRVASASTRESAYAKTGRQRWYPKVVIHLKKQ